jgi:hypothetical protein
MSMTMRPSGARRQILPSCQSPLSILRCIALTVYPVSRWAAANNTYLELTKLSRLASCSVVNTAEGDDGICPVALGKMRCAGQFERGSSRETRVQTQGDSTRFPMRNSHCCCLQRITTTCECLWFKNMELLYPDPDTIASTRCDSHLLHGAVDEVGASVREGN